jgi:two-component system, NtrC family, nitrogen regulation response regulator GlnG
VVVATNVDVLGGVAKGTFRKDLYYRLRTHHLQLPPLRERSGDLKPLVEAFVKKAAKALKKALPSIPQALYQLLNTYSFPGNLRELEAMVFDAVARHQETILSLQSFRDVLNVRPDEAAAMLPEVDDDAAVPDPLIGVDLLPTLQQAEERLIAEALRRADGNQGVAAGLLGLSRQALNKRLARQQQAGEEDEG